MLHLICLGSLCLFSLFCCFSLICESLATISLNVSVALFLNPSLELRLQVLLGPSVWF